MLGSLRLWSNAVHFFYVQCIFYCWLLFCIVLIIIPLLQVENFSEMKGDVGMSPHEKEGEQKDAYTKIETLS